MFINCPELQRGQVVIKRKREKNTVKKKIPYTHDKRCEGINCITDGGIHYIEV